ncbi:hypothetical protein EB796_018325 [Bugula neritina]|uniref:Uncharacterized protein n=1 Tax=Bugula neritina TaxID=10212 RepID=A0A7J7JDB6_BUGNE|nr:hypothetical protein EB796_018325 [Bugula neritina]
MQRGNKTQVHEFRKAQQTTKRVIPVINLDDEDDQKAPPLSSKRKSSELSSPISRKVLKSSTSTQYSSGSQFNSSGLSDRTSISKSQASVPTSMDETILKFYHSTRQTPEVYHQKLSLIDQIFKCIQPYFARCGLYLVGSSITGFETGSSDVDLSLMLNNGQVPWRTAIQYLGTIKAFLDSKMRGKVRGVTLIRATVPILHFCDTASDREYDMSLNNDVAVRNSHLLRCYHKYDQRVGPLVVFVKRWAKFHNINSAKDKTISSYVFTLMVIHYLQMGVPGLQCCQLYNIHTQCNLILIFMFHLFKENIQELDMFLEFPPQKNSGCSTLSVGQLFSGFLRYFAHQYNYKRDVASVKHGRIFHINSVKHKRIPFQDYQKSSWDGAQMYIEEPFSLTNAARSVYDENVFSRIHRVFVRSSRALDQSKDINSVLQHPF